jgi:hypothetical protein
VTPRKVGFTKDDDRLIINAVQQPDANPEDAEFWEEFAAIVFSRLI